MRKDGGFALILVIWCLVLMTSMATGFAYAVRHEIRTANDLADLARAEAAAEAAIRFAVLAVTTGDDEARWEVNGQPRNVPWPDAKITVRARAESDRIDLNRAHRDLLHGLFEQLLPDANADALADAVVDWRDPDDETEPDGAEQDDYTDAGYAYGPTNRPFYSVHELSQVAGFDKSAFEIVSPYLTVHGRQSRVNAESADLVVLSAVPGIERADAEAFIEYREEALAAGERLKFDLLREGRRFINTRRSHSVFTLDVLVNMTDGLSRRQRTVVQTDSAQAFRVLAQETLPPSESEAQPTTEMQSDQAL